MESFGFNTCVPSHPPSLYAFGGRPDFRSLQWCLASGIAYSVCFGPGTPTLTVAY